MPFLRPNPYLITSNWIEIRSLFKLTPALRCYIVKWSLYLKGGKLEDVFEWVIVCHTLSFCILTQDQGNRGAVHTIEVLELPKRGEETSFDVTTQTGSLWGPRESTAVSLILSYFFLCSVFGEISGKSFISCNYVYLCCRYVLKLLQENEGQRCNISYVFSMSESE
ncbi:hypothetical protein AVEN_83466-1 [Araneus ventricosus]|uniref:Uncharacterized protein n=1 Tax=Araneus ventricosus TaxID=182803 RepID=A0A4Y2JQ33_ARAVE|nr:hypothetical protein AVEN_83466-1 [Araneus ventricosus]